MRIILQTVTIFLIFTAGFVAFQNLMKLPWDIMQYFWYGWLPCCTASAAFLYGFTAKRSGGSILIIAACVLPFLCFSTRYALPFASHLTHIPTLLTSAILTLPMEMIGRHLKRKKQVQKEPAESNI